jgi:hypothetical protein
VVEEPISNAELARRLGDLRSDLHDDLGEIKRQLSQLVPREVYDAHRAAFDERIRFQAQLQEGLRKDFDAAADERRQALRLVVGSVAVPIIIVIVQILLSIKGVKP